MFDCVAEKIFINYYEIECHFERTRNGRGEISSYD